MSSPSAEFSNPFALAVDGAGHIYIADDPASLTMLAADGEVVRRIGRKGSGPGEYQSLSNVQVLSGDTLLAYDPVLERATLYGPNQGAQPHMVHTRLQHMMQFPYLVARVGSNRLLTASTTPFLPGGSTESDAGHKQVLRIMDLNGAVSEDSILVLPDDESLVIRNGESVSVGSNPFGGRTLVRVDRGERIVTGFTDSSRVDIHTLSGRRIGGFTIDHRRRAVTAGDVAKAEAAVPPMGGREQIIRRAIREAAPSYWPLYHDLVVDDAGNVWVGFASHDDVTREWTVYNGTGVPTASLSLPESYDLKVIRNGVLYGFLRDENDVASVVVFKLSSSPTSPVRS